MKMSDIKVGRTYVNRGKGRTWRKVLAIGNGFRPPIWFSTESFPDEYGVKYIDNTGRVDCLYISSFARWCGSEKEMADD